MPKPLEHTPVTCCAKVKQIREKLDEFVQQGFLRDSEYVKGEILRTTRGSHRTVTELYLKALAGSDSCDRPQYRDGICSICFNNENRDLGKPDNYVRYVSPKDRQRKARDYHFRMRVKKKFESALKSRPNLSPEERERVFKATDKYIRDNYKQYRRKVVTNKSIMATELTLEGVTKTRAKWAELNGISEQTVRQRLRRGIPDYVAVRDLPEWILRAFCQDDDRSKMRQELLKRTWLIDDTPMTAKQRRVLKAMYLDRLDFRGAAAKVGIAKQDLAQTEMAALKRIFDRYPLETNYELKFPPPRSLLPGTPQCR